jgi:caffeoyl-CoA O-methyltransferase
MEILNESLQNYLDRFIDEEDVLLQEITRDTHLHVMLPRMISGHFQGRVLSMISKMIKPKAILEIGTFTGYSALCLAEGLAEDGSLVSIDINEELECKILSHWSKSRFAHQMELKIGNALEIIPSLPHLFFDLVFIDADKKNYQAYYDLVVGRLVSGGLILADNVLWSGKVLDETIRDKDTIAMKSFNEYVLNDERVEKFILPIRDGIFVVRKK